MSSIENTRAADLQNADAGLVEAWIGTDHSQKGGARCHNKIGNHGFSVVESAQIAAEQSYSAGCSHRWRGRDITLEFMLEQNGKSPRWRSRAMPTFFEWFCRAPKQLIPNGKRCDVVGAQFHFSQSAHRYVQGAGHRRGRQSLQRCLRVLGTTDVHR